MAETFLFFIAEKVLTKIASQALQEIRFAWGLDSNLRKLEQNLNIIKAVLLDAEEHQAQNHELRIWLGMLKMVCYDAEDVLDELEYEALRKRVLKLYGNPLRKAGRLVSSSNPLALRVKIGHKIKELRQRLDDIADQKSKFHLTELVDYRLVARRQREMTDSLLRTSNVIGRDEDKKILIKMLLETNVNVDDIVTVIPIIGIGGMGKTTLAKMLYNDVSIDEHFELKIWVCVSEEFDKKNVMVKMIHSLTHQNLSYLDPDQLQTLIQDKLNNKKFLLVLDDLWSDDRYKWVEFRDLLEGCASGSKVIVTTRSASVAMAVSTVSPYNLQGLSHEDCLSLFKKWAFKEREEESSPQLLKIGKSIVRKCGGLPLAVRTLGTLLYSKIDERYWKFIRDNEIWKLEQNENDILPALRLSYDQMPSHLKPCFAICSTYPKDTQINSIELSQIWMAHGLLGSSDEQKDMEDIGSQFIKELHSRSFLHDFEDFGHYSKFKMHDLVHDLALSVLQSECCVLNVRSKNIPDAIRHLSICRKHLLDQTVPRFLQKENNLQTLVFPTDVHGPASESFVATCISTCQKLRILCLQGSSFELLPRSIGNLKHLRYLDLSGNHKMKKLPDSICKLHNLQALSLGGCSELVALPRKIRHLVNLRTLEITVKQKYLPEDEIGSLRSLRFLSIGDCANLEFLFEEMQNLTSLRFLNIWDCKCLISLPRDLKYLPALETLNVSGCDRLNLMEKEDWEDAKTSLRFLMLDELPQLVTLPDWFQRYSRTLESLSISRCENFSSFPKWFLYFTSLKKIEIQWCPALLSLPTTMVCLGDLKELKIKNCPALHKRCEKEKGEDWYKIAHVPDIDIDDGDEGTSFVVD